MQQAVKDPLAKPRDADEAHFMGGKDPAGILRGICILVGGVLAIVLLGAGILFTIFRYEWQETQDELAARGEVLTLRDFSLKPVPEEENFFADDLWREILNRTSSNSRNGSHRLEALKNPAKPADLVELTKLLGDKPSASNMNLLSMLAAAARGIATAEDPARQRELAEFILERLAPSAALLDHITALASRPKSEVSADFAHYLIEAHREWRILIDLSLAFSCRAYAQLTLGHAASATEDIDTLLRLGNVPLGHPTLTPLLVRHYTLGQTAACIDFGIRRRVWSEKDLREFDRALGRIAVFEPLVFALRTNRAAINDRIASQPPGSFRVGYCSPYSAIPDDIWHTTLAQCAYGFLATDRELSAFNRFHQHLVDHLANADLHGIESSHFRWRETYQENAFGPPILLWNDWNVSELAVVKSAQLRNELNLVRIACAIERHRLRTGALPETLAELVPAELAELPANALDGQPAQYRRDGDAVRLWIFGWDGDDDHGRVSTRRDPRDDGDWVLGQPPGSQRK